MPSTSNKIFAEFTSFVYIFKQNVDNIQFNNILHKKFKFRIRVKRIYYYY